MARDGRNRAAPPVQRGHLFSVERETTSVRGGAHPPLRALAVLPTDVVNAADRRPVSDRAVRSAPVVGLEPVWQRGVAVSMRAVADALRPFALHRLVEAFDLPVRPRPVGLGRQVADLATCE